MSKKRIIFFLVIVGVIVAVYALYVGLSSNSLKEVSIENTSGSEAEDILVDITNLGEYPTITNGREQNDLSTALITKLKKNSVSESVNGVVRVNTVQTVQQPYEGSDGPASIPTTSFIIDLESIKQSYNVSWSGGNEYPYNILTVTCLGESQAIYKEFKCVDDEDN